MSVGLMPPPPDSDLANELPLNFWVFPELALPPSPPLAVLSSPPLASLSPCSMSDSFSCSSSEPPSCLDLPSDFPSLSDFQSSDLSCFLSQPQRSPLCSASLDCFTQALFEA